MSNFPVHMYNKDGAQLTVDNQIDYNKALAKGYRKGYTHLHFPKTVFHEGDGATAVVNNEQELKALGAGWGEDFVAPVVEKPKLPSEVSAGESATVRALLAETRDAINRIDQLEEDVDAQAKEIAHLKAQLEPHTKGKKSDKDDGK